MAIVQNLNESTVSGKIVSIDYTQAVINNQDALYGTVTVESGEDNFIPVGFFSYKLKKDKTENGIYKSLMTVINEYKTISKDGREAADSVEINKAQISENLFFVDQGQRLIRGFQIGSSFFNRKAVTTPQATFTITGEIFEMVEEVENDVPTGALILRLLVLGYEGRPNIIDFRVEDAKGVDYIKTVATVGQDIKINGDIVVREIVEEKKEEAAFGDPIVTSTRHTVRQLIVKSATPPATGALTDEERAIVLAKREGLVIEAKEKAMKKAASSNTPSKPSASNFSL
jgi:hypothetical protein